MIRVSEREIIGKWRDRRRSLHSYRAVKSCRCDGDVHESRRCPSRLMLPDQIFSLISLSIPS